MKHSELRHQPRHVNPRIQVYCGASKRKRINELLMGEKIPEELYRTCLKSALDGREGRTGFPQKRNVMQAFCLHHTRKDCLSYASSIQYVILHFTQKTTFLQCGYRFGRIFLYHNALFSGEDPAPPEIPGKERQRIFQLSPFKNA